MAAFAPHEMVSVTDNVAQRGAQKKPHMVIYIDVLCCYIVIEIVGYGGVMKIHIQEIRARRGLTQQQLAALVGKKRSTIAMYEGGCIDIPVRVLCRIAHILRVPVGQLIQPNSDAVTSRSQERGAPERHLIHRKS